MEGQRLRSHSWCGGLQEQEPSVQLGQTGMHGVGGRRGLNQQVCANTCPFHILSNLQEGDKNSKRNSRTPSTQIRWTSTYTALFARSSRLSPSLPSTYPHTYTCARMHTHIPSCWSFIWRWRPSLPLNTSVCISKEQGHSPPPTQHSDQTWGKQQSVFQSHLQGPF